MDANRLLTSMMTRVSCGFSPRSVTALGESQLAVAYQPKVDVVDGRVVGLEALAPWTHPSRGPISPEPVIPLAVATRLIAPAPKEYVLDHALARQARALADALPPCQRRTTDTRLWAIL